MTWRALFRNPLKGETHFGLRGEAACGRHLGRRRYVTGLLTSTVLSAVTCERCRRSKAFRVVAAGAKRSGSLKQELGFQVGDTIVGFGSTATVLAVRGHEMQIRWVDGRVTTVQGELVERFTKQ